MPKPASYSSAVGIPLPSDEAIRDVIGESYDPEQALNVVKMLAGTEDLYEAAVGFVKAVFSANGVDPKLRQMIILRAAKVLNAPYEWQANVALSRNNGLSDLEIEAAGNDGPVDGVEESLLLVCRATDEMSTTGTLTDPTLEQLRKTHGDVITRKIVLMISWFNLLSLFLNGCRVPLETSDKIGAKRTPLG